MFKKSLISTKYDAATKTHDISTRTEFSFAELGYLIISENFDDAYTMLVSNTKTAVFEKMRENNKNKETSSIITCCLTATIYLAYLIHRCNATSAEVKEFRIGMQKGYSDITSNNKRVFDENRIKTNMGIFASIAHTYLEEWGAEDDQGCINMLNGGTKTTDLIVAMLFERFIKEDELSEIEVIIQQQITGGDVACFSELILEVVINSIKRKS